VRDLQRDGVVSPSGGAVWNFQGIVGGLKKRGLIHNRLYAGELVRNRFKNVKNPRGRVEIAANNGHNRASFW
jgi:hypothetical protein